MCKTVRARSLLGQAGGVRPVGPVKALSYSFLAGLPLGPPAAAAAGSFPQSVSPEEREEERE